MGIIVYLLVCLSALGSVLGDKCNFERGLCSFTQDKKDNFNWSIGSSDTPTTDTGPSYDHTLGKNGTGHYIFIETSGKKSWSRPTARLSSRLFGPSKSVCVSFHYHMYGKDAGRLSVFLRQRGRLSAPIWTMMEDQGNEWIKVSVRTRSDIDYQVVFEAARGAGFRSDIALDDIAIVNGSCRGKAHSVVSSTSLLDAVIGTKVDKSPGGEMLPHLIPSRNNEGQSNTNNGAPHITEIASTNYIFNTKFVTNLMIVGLLFWSIVFILLCFVVWKSRGRSKKKEYQGRVSRDSRVRQSAVSTQVELENPLNQQTQHPGYRGDNVTRTLQQSDVLFPKTEPDDDEKWESFKSRAGLDKGASSFKDRYSLTSVDKDLYMYYEEERTANEWKKTTAGDYV